MKRLVAFVALVLGSTFLAVLLPVLAVWIWAAELFAILWRFLWK